MLVEMCAGVGTFTCEGWNLCALWLDISVVGLAGVLEVCGVL